MNPAYHNPPISPAKKPFQLALFSEQNFYHSASDKGFFALAQKRKTGWHQESYQLEMMPYVLGQIDKNLDSYISQGEFWKRNRRILNLARIGLCFLDIDIYKTNYRGMSPDRVTFALLEFCDENLLPHPSTILSSGNGLYAKWFFDGSLPAQALPRWNLLQRELVKRFACFGADPQARDASRVLRIEGTVNTKTGQFVRVLYPHNPSQTPALYSFEELFDTFAPASRADFAKKYKTILPPEIKFEILQGGQDEEFLKKKIQRNMAANSPRFGLNAMRLNWDRLGDLRKLAQMRGWTEGNPDGSRDPFLFLGIVFMSWLTSPDQLYHEALEMARQWAPHWDHATTLNKASSAVKRAKAAAAGEKVFFNGKETDPRYRYKTETVIQELLITPEEQKQLKNLAAPEVVLERKKETAGEWRRAHGQVSREEYSWAALEKPWRDFGYSRKTWYRKGCPVPDRLQKTDNYPESLNLTQVRMYV